MRIIKNPDGQLAVFMVLVLPLFALFLAFFVNIILLIDARISMQGAVDRGAYAGAGYLAHVMNEVAIRNRLFNEAYLNKEKEFGSKSKVTKEWIDKRIKELRSIQSRLLTEMNILSEEAYGKAHEVAKDVIARNQGNRPQLKFTTYTDKFYKSRKERAFKIIDDCDDSGNCVNHTLLGGTEISGNDFDPTGHEDYSFDVLKYLIKDGSYVAIVSGAELEFNAPLLPEYLGGKKLRLRAIAAAQPYGGSIKKFQDNYHPRLIPAAVPGYYVGGIDVAH